MTNNRTFRSIGQPILVMEKSNLVSGKIWIDYSGSSDKLSFKGIENENGEVSVTEEERIRYTKSKPIVFSGTEFDSINDEESPIYIENFTDVIKNGGKFYQTDMFGMERTVTTEDLIEFITENYQY
jgi:hypothetical protein